MVIDIENDGRITGFQVNRALQLEEFETGAIRCLTETPIAVQTFEIPEQMRKAKGSVTCIGS